MKVGGSRPGIAALRAKQRSIAEFERIGPAVRAHLKRTMREMLGRDPRPDEKMVDLIAEAERRRNNGSNP